MQDSFRETYNILLGRKLDVEQAVPDINKVEEKEGTAKTAQLGLLKGNAY